MLVCRECGKLWGTGSDGERCGVRLNGREWCDGRLVEHGCGGPREACARPGCDECGTPAPLANGIVPELVAELAQVTRERDEAREQERARASVKALLAIVEPLPCWAQFCETPPAVEWAESASLRLWIPSCDEHARGGLGVRDRPHAAAIREALAALREET